MIQPLLHALGLDQFVKNLRIVVHQLLAVIEVYSNLILFPPSFHKLTTKFSTTNDWEKLSVDNI